MDDYPLSMVATEDREPIAKLMSKTSGETTFNNIEFQSVHRNGEKRWMAVSAQPMFDESNRHLGLIDSEIERISAITHQMYQLYRRTPPRPNRFAIERTVAEVVTLVASVAAKADVRLKVESSGKPMLVLLPEGEVKRKRFIYGGRKRPRRFTQGL